MALRCRYELKRSDFGVAPGFMNAELIDTLVLDQTLICTTVSREERFQSMPDPVRAGIVAMVAATTEPTE